jgi:hypothetical protein
MLAHHILHINQQLRDTDYIYLQVFQANTSYPLVIISSSLQCLLLVHFTPLDYNMSFNMGRDPI